MEPVRVVCPSCHGKLVVRLESLLGQLVVCPRCKSNVRIPDAPAVPSTTAPASYDSSAITRVDDGQLAQHIAAESEKPGGLFDLDEQSIDHAIESFRPAHDELIGSRSSSSKASEPLVDPSAPLEPLVRDEVVPPGPMSDWSPPETKRRQQILLIAMAGLATTLLAIVGLIAFLQTQSSPAPVVQIPADKPEPVQPIESLPEPIASGDRKPDATDMKKTDDVSVQPEPPLVIAPPEPSLTQTQALTQTQDQQAPPKTDLQPNSIQKMLPDPTPLLGNTTANEPVGVNDPLAPSSSEIPEAMMRLSQIFDAGSLRLMPDAIANDAPTPGAELGAEKVDIETLYHPSPVTPPPMDAIVSKPISRLATKDPVPLSSILLLLGQLSGGGIGWDIETVRMTGFNVDALVSLEVEGTTVGDVIKEICRENHLIQSVDPQDVLRLNPEPNAIISRLPTDWSLDDLIPHATSRDAWQVLIRKLYPAWSQEWELQGTKLEWSETASPLHRATVAAFLDQVRVANGLSPKSTIPDTVIDARLGLDASQEPLSRVGSKLIEHPMSLPQLLSIAARESGLHLLFDWDAIFSHGFAHSKTATSLLRGRTWPEIAKWSMDEFNLVAVVDGADQIILTTLPRQRRIWRTVLVKLDAGKTIESVRDSFRVLSPTDESGRSMLLVNPIPSVGDSTDSWVVVRICPPNTAQLQARSIREALRLPTLMKKEP